MKKLIEQFIEWMFNKLDQPERIGGVLIHDGPLVNYRWYRAYCGGYWEHSKRLGWRQRHKWVYDLAVQHAMDQPHMYAYGKDLECWTCVYDHVNPSLPTDIIDPRR